MVSIGAALRLTGRALIDTYRRGFLVLMLAPLAVALTIVPEFAQHIAEIQNGMFDSRAGAQAFANSALRWNFGYVKLTGLALTLLAIPRFWWCHEHGGRWWQLRGIAWQRLFGGVALFMLISALSYPLRGRVDPEWVKAADLLLSLATLPLIFFILSGLFGDRRISLGHLYRRSWPHAVLLLALLTAAFAPTQLLHGLLHKWSIGQTRPLIWTLMTFDALVVGLLASLVGSAFYTGYKAMADRRAHAAT